VSTEALFASVRIAGRDGGWRVTVADGTIADLSPAERAPEGLLLPLFADVHVHLDKTGIIDRVDGLASGLLEAIDATRADALNWTDDDLTTRAGDALERAWQHGTRAMRSHVDWRDPGVPLAWEVLNGMKDDWRGRVELQLASLVPLDDMELLGRDVARRVAADGGVFGAFVLGNDDQARKIALTFDLAEEFGLPLDFHVDETLDDTVTGIDLIVAETERRGMAGRVLCGHCCALSRRPRDIVLRLLDRAAGAGVGLVALPTSNAYLQDSTPGRTPVFRGLAPIQEARASGIDTMLASDNCRDPFFPYGDYDMLEILRLGVVNARLDPQDWIGAVTDLPMKWLGLDQPPIATGAPADFIHFAATSVTDLIARSSAARKVYRRGVATAAPPGTRQTHRIPA
jgi:cytosine deaminase